MRRGKICIAIGAFIIGTALICNSNRPEIYNKKANFNNPEEVIDILNNNLLSSYKDEYTHEIVYSDKFLECLSNRKRITGSNLYAADYNLHINEQKENQEYKDNIISAYKAMLENMKGYKPCNEIKAYNLVGTSKGLDGEMSDEDMDVVFIDEGEGWVIDYIIVNQKSNPGSNYDRS